MAAPDGNDDLREAARQAAQDIEALGRAGLRPDQFFRLFLELIAERTRAGGGIVWVLTPQGGLNAQCDFGGAVAAIQRQPALHQPHAKWLQEALGTGESKCLFPDVTGGPVILLGIVHAGEGPAAVAELLVRPDVSKDAASGLLEFLEHACAAASQALARKGAAADDAEKFRGEFEQFVWLLMQSPALADVASAAASDGRVLLACDRLSVVVQRGRKKIVQAVSGQKTVNPRANLTQALLGLASQVMATGEPFVFRGQTTGLPPSISTLLSEFVRESGAREVHIVPLFEPERTVDPKEAERGARRRETPRLPVGALVVEFLGEKQPDPELAAKLPVVADHVGVALAHALTREQVFLLPLWTRLGRIREWFFGRRMAQVGAVFGAIILVLLILAFVPWEYRVEGQGRLMPVIQQRVFAPWDGEIVELKVRAGEKVSEGQHLVTLRNDELRSQLLTSRNQLYEKSKHAASLQAQIDDAIRNGTKEDRVRLQGQLEETRAEIVGLIEQVKLLEERMEQLKVKSPREGVVATFQVEQLLLHRPVKRGDVLLEVMDESGPWRLEVQVPEHRMFHVLRACEARGSKQLPVEFVPANVPEQTFEGTLEEIATRAATAEQEGRVVEVFVAFDRDSLPTRRIGAEVRARIACGPKSLGYVLFGDVIEFLQRKFWWW